MILVRKQPIASLALVLLTWVILAGMRLTRGLIVHYWMFQPRDFSIRDREAL